MKQSEWRPELTHIEILESDSPQFLSVVGVLSGIEAPSVEAGDEGGCEGVLIVGHLAESLKQVSRGGREGPYIEQRTEVVAEVIFEFLDRLVEGLILSELLHLLSRGLPEVRGANDRDGMSRACK